jgi:hypothetical protein
MYEWDDLVEKIMAGEAVEVSVGLSRSTTGRKRKNCSCERRMRKVRARMLSLEKRLQVLELPTYRDSSYSRQENDEVNLRDGSNVLTGNRLGVQTPTIGITVPRTATTWSWENYHPSQAPADVPEEILEQLRENDMQLW